MKFIVPYWRSLWKLWSVRLTLLGTALSSFFLAFPDAVLQAWMMLPPDLKQYLPQQWIQGVVVVIFVLSVIARLVPQPKVQAEVDRAKESSK